jgi:outer membrane biosynthesis protein TonB
VSRATTDIRLPAAPQVVKRATSQIALSTQTSVRPAPPPPPPPPPPQADGKSNPRVITEVKPAYPQEALRYGVAATVWVAVSIDANGQVAEAKANRFQLTIDRSIEDPNYWASKPERPFIEAAESTALRWKFAPPDANTRTSVEVLFTFRMVPGPAVVRVSGPVDIVSPDERKIVRVGNGIRIEPPRPRRPQW